MERLTLPAEEGRAGVLDRAAPASLEQALWRDLLAAADEARFGEAWLGLTCRMIPGAVGGVLLLQPADGEPLAPVARWPAGSPADAGMVAAALAAYDARRGAVQPLPGTGPQPPTRLAYPIMLDDRPFGAATIDIAPASGQSPREAMRQLQWAAAWIRDFCRRRELAAQRTIAERTTLALDMLAAALEEERFVAACRIAATELAIRLGCDRVAIGMTRRRTARVVAVSHSAQFGRQMRLLRQLGDAMDEAIDQRAVILFPPADDSALMTRAQSVLATAGGGRVLTVPMLLKDRFVGAVTFERADTSPFDAPTVELAEAVVAILAPALLDKREIDRWLAAKIGSSIAWQVGALLGPMHLGRKLLVLLLVLVAAVAQFARGEYRVAADGRVQGVVQRALVAPFDGFVADAAVKAGDTVHAGQTMVTLDDRDLLLDRLRWTTERRQHSDEYDQALSAGKRADAARAQAQVAEADAQIALVDAQLGRARMTAPFEGLVISGDLSQSIGAPVRRGDMLFEVAPLDDYQVELAVPESQVDDVHAGEHGNLVVGALPDHPFPFTVIRTTPVAVAHDGRMVFRVDAKLDAGSDRLRPGMEGVGKIEIGRRRLVWIWLRSMIDWARLTAWQWLP